MEALSSGTAVVASDIPGHQLMGAGIASCVITPHDPVAIATATEQLIDRDDHEVAADALASHLWMRQHLHLPKWSAGLVDRYEHALADYSAAVRLSPNDAYALYSLGLTLRALGREEEARTNIAKAKEVEPGIGP